MLISLLLFSCGKQRKNVISRTYHKTTTLFNWYYNGELAWKEGVATVEGSFMIPPEGFIPIMYFGDDAAAQSAVGNFDAAIEKAETAIYKHDQDKNKWIDNCRFLIGRSWFYKRDYFLASQNFEYIIKTWPKSKIIPDVKIWLAKTYYMSDRKPMAQKLLDEEVSKMKLKKRQKGELALLEATMLMDGEDYNGAAKLLMKNLRNFRGRLNKARVHFFLGQLYAVQGKFSKAYEHYKKVARMNTDYQLIFNAKIQQVRLLIENQAGQDETKKIRNTLRRMLRDEKNIDYQDQILYELAMLEFKKENFPDAVAWLKESVRANTVNQRQKALSYYKAGQIYFYNMQDYDNAAIYFDSAATVISPDAPEYQEIQSIGATLKDYVAYTTTIQYKDSMLWLASMSDAQLERQVEKIISEEKRREQVQKQKEIEAQNRLNNPNFFDPNASNGPQVSGFYFDNPEAVSSGRLEFQRTWGQRKNEDHWRRKVKDIQFSSNEEEEEEGEEAAAEDTLLAKKFGDKYKYYKDIPQTEEEKAAYNADVRAAMFNLGQLYDKRLEEPDSAVKVYNTLIKRYPDSDEALKARFALYNLYSELDPYLADDYSDYICTNHPSSIYCKLINGESVYEDLNREQLDFQSAYTALFTTYDNKDYSTVLNFADFLISKYNHRDEIPQVYYLRGMSYGYLGNRDSLRRIFTHLTTQFPEAEVTPIAKRTLDLMDGKKTVSTDGEKGENSGNSGDLEDKVDDETMNDPRYKGFVRDPKANERLFVVMLIDKSQLASNELKVKISSFNSANFKNERLSTSIFFYKQVQHLAYISQFKSMELAQNYINIARQDDQLKNLYQGENDRIMFITPNNFKTAYGKKRFEDYYDFYQNVILPTLKK